MMIDESPKMSAKNCAIKRTAHGRKVSEGPHQQQQHQQQQLHPRGLGVQAKTNRENTADRGGVANTFRNYNIGSRASLYLPFLFPSRETTHLLFFASRGVKNKHESCTAQKRQKFTHIEIYTHTHMQYCRIYVSDRAVNVSGNTETCAREPNFVLIP